MFIASIFRTVAIYLGLVQADTGDLCLACQYNLARRGGAFCQGCETPAKAKPVRKEFCGIDGCTYPASHPVQHYATNGCKSGKRPHCTCDYCF